MLEKLRQTTSNRQSKLKTQSLLTQIKKNRLKPLTIPHLLLKLMNKLFKSKQMNSPKLPPLIKQMQVHSLLRQLLNQKLLLLSHQRLLRLTLHSHNQKLRQSKHQENHQVLKLNKSILNSWRLQQLQRMMRKFKELS
jgi:hypothetical protein